MELIKQKRPDLLVECLVSDFAGDLRSVDILANSGLDVYAHNLETVRRLQRHVRDHRASYDQSLAVLRYAKEAAERGQNRPQQPNEITVRRKKMLTKSSIMLGLGETDEEVLQEMRDLREANVDVVTFGWYFYI